MIDHKTVKNTGISYDVSDSGEMNPNVVSSWPLVAASSAYTYATAFDNKV